VEMAKDDAMRDIARSGNAYTRYYWNLAVETTDCPNWIARWFLYHKFRYRDGRNRNPSKGTSSGGSKRDRRDMAAGKQDGHGYYEAFGVISYGMCHSYEVPSFSATAYSHARFLIWLLSFGCLAKSLFSRHLDSNAVSIIAKHFLTGYRALPADI